MTALPLRLGMPGEPEDEAPPAPRSRRDWIVDSALFLLAIAIGGAELADAVDRGLEAPLLVLDAIGGAALCLALWWRRRWPFALGLAAAPIVAISSSAGTAGVIILFTVAAYRPWQQAFLVAGLQLAVAPIQQAVNTDISVTELLVGTLVTVALVASGMVVRGRREARRERVGRTRAEQQLRAEQIRYAARARRTASASAAGTRPASSVAPQAVSTPALSKRSLTASGTPHSAPPGSPRAQADSARRASPRARSRHSARNAPSDGSSATIRAESASTTSTGDSDRSR
jgi:hypothetical protein